MDASATNLLDSKIFDKVVFGGVVGKITLLGIVGLVTILAFAGICMFAIPISERVEVAKFLVWILVGVIGATMAAVFGYSHWHPFTSVLEGTDLVKHHQQEIKANRISPGGELKVEDRGNVRVTGNNG